MDYNINSMNSNGNTVISKVRKSYTAAYKLKVVELALEIGVTKAARVFNICHSMVSRWVKNVLKFKVSKPHCRKIGSGRTPAHPELETQLHSDTVLSMIETVVQYTSIID